MKKILVLASTFPRWENDTTPPFVFELEKRLAKDFAITVLAPHYPGAKKIEKRENMTIIRFQYFWPATLQKLCYDGGILPNLKKNKLLFFQAGTLLFFELIAAIKIVKNKKIDLIHAHWIIPQGIIALIIKKLLGIPYIATTHGGDIYGLRNKFLLGLKKKVLENAQKITVVSTAIKDEIIKKINPHLDISIISMGVDAKLFNPDKYDKSIKEKYNITGPFLLFVGRLAEKKGVEYLLRAMPKIIKGFPKTKLLIIGEGTLKKNLVKLTNDLNIEKNIIFTGAIPNIQLPKYYATADIVIFPSVTTSDGDKEGLPVSILESLASGTNVIATDTGGISDVIKNDYNGLLIQPQDITSITTATIALLKNHKKMQSYRNNSLKLINDYTWGNITKKYHQLIERT